MSAAVRVALVGISGYGASYLRPFFEEPVAAGVQLVGAIDTQPERCPQLDRIKALNIPVCTSLEDFFAAHTADLVIVSSPIHWHCRQSCLAMRHGAHVLCEKPVAGSIQEAREMAAVAKETGKFVAIGYQWSYAPAIHALKADILAGALGQPQLLKTLVCWPRRESYYARNNWAGKLQAADGTWILDSPVNNATAHYLHNMFYVLGDQVHTSAVPATVIGELYRANPIENYDVAALRCRTTSGVTLAYYCAHSVSELIGPLAEYRFSKATVTFESQADKPAFVARFADGREKVYGDPNDQHGKFYQAVEAVRTGNLVACDVTAAASQTLCMNGLQESAAIANFPAELVDRTGEAGDRLVYVHGLHEALSDCFAAAKLPSELGSLAWAKPGKAVDLTNYHRYPGG